MLTKEQIEIVMSKIVEKKNGCHDLLEMVFNAFMQSERKVFLEESNDGNKGNGYRPFRAFQDGKSLELRIPRDRLGFFKPLILSIYRRHDLHLQEIAFELYSKGLTTRQVGSVMDKIYGESCSKSKISRISRHFYQELESWRNRPLESYYKAVFIDGTVVKVLQNNKYQNHCFYVMLGLKTDNKREIISVLDFPQESSTAWEVALQELRGRGVERIGIIVSDALTGLEKVVAKVFPGVPHQLCCVHLMRRLSSYVSRQERSAISQDFKQVIDINNPSHTQQKAFKAFEEFSLKWSRRSKALAAYLKRLDISPYLVCLQYDYRIRAMLYTTNWIERFNRSAKRTLKIRGAMPDAESVLALISTTALDLEQGAYNYPIYQFNFEDKI